MSSKTPKKITVRSNGAAKRNSVSGRVVSKRSDSKAAALTERAWKKTYENRNKTKTAA
jgi:hypothetical protein